MTKMPAFLKLRTIQVGICKTTVDSISWDKPFDYLENLDLEQRAIMYC